MNHHHFKSCSECPLFQDSDYGNFCGHPGIECFIIKDMHIIDPNCPMLKAPSAFTVDVGPKLGELPCPECGKFQVPKGKRYHHECAKIRTKKNIRKYRQLQSLTKKKKQV